MVQIFTCIVTLLSTVLTAGAAYSLKDAFGQRFDVGAAVPDADMTDSEKALLFQQFTTVTPENCMKPEPIHPAEDRYDFAKADKLVDMARANGLTVNGHTLVWHNQCPEWLFLDGDRRAGRQLVLKRMRDHIATVAGRYAGKVASWDVINEAIDDGKQYLRKSSWHRALGESFISEAFIAAHQADPKAELYYNDYAIESGPKREKTLRLIRELKAGNVPIHGVGIQGHWTLDRIPFIEIEEAIELYHAAGVKVMITELDVSVLKRKTDGANINVKEADVGDPFVNGLPPKIQQRLAHQYAQLFALFLKHQDKISRVTFWGLHDGRSWLNGWPRKATNHPLLWDRSLQPKPALNAVLGVESASH